MKHSIKKIAALFLCLMMVISSVPGAVFAAGEGVYTINVVDKKGNPVAGATVTGAYKWFFGSATDIAASNILDNGDGSYTVNVDEHYSNGNYTFTWTASYDGGTPVSVQFTGDTKVITIKLSDEIGGTAPEETEPEVTEPEVTEPLDPDGWYDTFWMYYYLRGNYDDPFPPTYAGAMDIGEFGPSGDNIPFATITVDLNKLKNEYSDVAVYQVGQNGNEYHFIPSTNSPSKEDAEKFWAAVEDCMTEESKKQYQASGLADLFVGYVLKRMNQGEAHCDGYLQAVPPVYSVELYMDKDPESDDVAGEANANYVGGLVTGKDDPHITKKQVIDALEGYLGHEITWNEDEEGNPVETDGKFTGTYIDEYMVSNIVVYQSSKDLQSPNLTSLPNSEIRYVKQNGSYYLARYIINIVSRHKTDCTVIYTDGEANGTAFYPHSYAVTLIEGETVTVPHFSQTPNREHYLFTGWKLRDGDGTLLTQEQVDAMVVTGDMIFDAQWKAAFDVIFHTNNAASEHEDIFRTYHTECDHSTEGDYLLNEGRVDVFYDIPTFSYNVHNGYIFKGWYLGTEETAAPMDWNAVYTEETHIYAHWILVGNVDKEEDGKIYKDNFYPEYDLLGNQIRTSPTNPGAHYGDAAPGLRFVTSLSERVYREMNAIHSNNSEGVEYGVLIARASNATAELKYKHSSLNGEDTTSSHSFVNNVPCRVAGKPVDDHYAGENYRLYTAVITYKNLTGDTLIAAQNTYFIGRSYIRYFDANGLERVHYNNYTGPSQTYGGVNTCYADVYAMSNQLRGA